VLLRRPWLATLVVATALTPVLGVSAAHAYDHQFTHRWLTRQAIAQLVQQNPDQYPLLAEWAERIVAGSEEEDDLFLDGDSNPTSMRLMRHFYRPTDDAGLTMEAFGTFESSYSWGGRDNEQNQWDYEDALAYYREGDLDRAFLALGHVLHLVQDATVPAHTHLDDHGPPLGDIYESYCTKLMHSEFDSDLPVPAAGAAIPRFEHPRSAWRHASLASYWRNMVPGALSHVDDNEASGMLAGMFPDIRVGLSNEWEIPGVGKLGTDFVEHEDGYYYFPNLAATGQLRRVAFDADDPHRFEYANGDGRPMVEAMARDLIPVAILDSAGVIQLFMEQTADLPVPGLTEMPASSGGCSAGTRSSSSIFTLCFLVVAFLSLRRPGTSC